MNYYPVAQPFQAWQLFLNINMFCCFCMLFLPVVLQMMRRGIQAHDLSKWVFLPAALGVMLLFSIPIAIYPWLWLMMGVMGAPKSEIAVAVIFTIISWALAVYAGFINPMRSCC